MMQYTNKNHYPKPIVDSVMAIQNQYSGPSPTDTKHVSVTTLLNPPLIRQLWRRHYDDIEVDIDDLLYSVEGTAMHQVIEAGADGEELVLLEQRYTTELAGLTVSGQSDYVHLFVTDPSTGHLYDIKNTSAYVVQNSTKIKDWTKQINMYKYLLSVHKVTIETASIVTWLRDWNRRDAKSKRMYPIHKIVDVPIKLFPNEKIKMFMEKLTIEHKEAQEQEVKDIKICPVKDRWYQDSRCKKYCAVGKFCPYGGKYYA